MFDFDWDAYNVEHIAHQILTFSLDYVEGTPLRFSPVMVELFCCDWAPRKIAGDAAKGAQRGAALLGDHVFYITDNAHMICLHRLTGSLMWDVAMPEGPGPYGGTSAPLVAGSLVIGGVAGGDMGIRGFLAAYDAMTGQQAWRF